LAKSDIGTALVHSTGNEGYNDRRQNTQSSRLEVSGVSKVDNVNRVDKSIVQNDNVQVT